MLQSLWRRGILTVSRRDGLKKYWDLTEKVHPEFKDIEPLDGIGLSKVAAQLSLKALGAGTAQHIKNHFTRDRYPRLGTALGELESAGKIVQVRVEESREDFNGRKPWYVHADDLPLLEQLTGAAWQPRTVLLSPFDNLIADRDRTELLWDFHFRIEIYVPAQKREYGYYVMPILHGERLIGRIDPRMDRKSGSLEIQAIYAEPGAPAGKRAVGGILQAIEDLATFLGASQIRYTGAVPEPWREKGLG